MRTSRPGGQLDRSSSSAAQKRTARDITGGVRDGYVSFHLVALLNGHLTYTLDLSAPSESAIQTDIYREWFHHLEADKGYYPDALIPVQLPYRSRLPEPDNRISGQTAQAFWVDMWIPSSTRPGLYRCVARPKAGHATTTLPIELKVLSAIVPQQDVVTVDHNSYGSSWLGDQYPGLARRRPDF